MLHLALLALPQTLAVDVETLPVPRDSDPAGYQLVDDRVLFITIVPGRQQLWSSDGTAGGTQLVFEWQADDPEVGEPHFTPVGTGAVFWRQQTVSGEPDRTTLWFTDATPTGTFEVASFETIFQGLLTPPTLPPLVPHQGQVYFLRDGDLWVCDGTAAGTFPIESINGFHPSDLVSMGANLFYLGEGIDPIQDALRVFEGPIAGSKNVKALGLPPENLTVLGDRLLFVSAVPEGPFGGLDSELWISDGTNAGTFELADLSLQGSSHPADFVVAGDTAFFTAEDATVGERWLLKTDGTLPGTKVLLLEEIRELVALDQGACFLGEDDSGSFVGFSDGTQAGTSTVPVSAPTLGFLEPERLRPGTGEATFETRLFSSQGVPTDGRALWLTDFTAGGTAPLHLATKDPTAPSLPQDDLVGFTFLRASFVAGHWWFSGRSEPEGREVWTSDGSPAGTGLLVDLTPGTTTFDSNPSHLTRFGERLFFYATSGGIRAPYAFDGSELVQLPLADPPPTTYTPNPQIPQPVELEGRVYFTNFDRDQLWSSDGTAAGTHQVFDASVATAGSFVVDELVAGDDHVFLGLEAFGVPRQLWVLGVASGAATLLQDELSFGMAFHSPLLYFRARTNETGVEPWVSDGTPGGTRLLADTNPGSPSSSVPEPQYTRYGDRVVFVAGSSPSEVWASNPEGTDASLAFDMNPLGSPWVERLATLGDTLLILSEQPPPGNSRKLWRSEGDFASTQILMGFPEFQGFAALPPSFEAAADRVYFPAYNASAGGAGWLWQSEGTIPSTTPLAPVFSTSGRLAALPGTSYASVDINSPAFGSELWLTDGSPAGTIPLTESMNPGARETLPGPVVRVGDGLYFSGEHPDAGRELIRLSISELGAFAIESFGSGCAGSSGVAPRAGWSGVPVPGASGSVDVTLGAPLAPAILGLSGSFQPVDLFGCTSFLGAPFQLLTSSTDVQGAGSEPIVLPANPALAGATLYFQWAIADPGGALFGAFGVSDALEVTLGA